MNTAGGKTRAPRVAAEPIAVEHPRNCPSAAHLLAGCQKGLLAAVATGLIGTFASYVKKHSGYFESSLFTVMAAAVDLELHLFRLMHVGRHAASGAGVNPPRGVQTNDKSRRRLFSSCACLISCWVFFSSKEISQKKVELSGFFYSVSKKEAGRIPGAVCLREKKEKSLAQ